jgi:hypothetical protein
MKVFLGPYKNYIGPFQIVDALFFWQEKYPGDRLDRRWDYRLSSKLGDWLAETWVNDLCETVHAWRGDRKMNIHIDKYDTWNVDGTLAPIILPLLRGLKSCKHGSAFVDMEDVPEYMRTTNTEDYDDQSTFDFYRVSGEDTMKYNIHDRWAYVLEEMIWAFEQIQADWEKQYWIVHPKLDLENYPEDDGKDITPLRWAVKGECDWAGRQKHQERIDRGLMLFGKYYQGLWS